MHLKISNKKDGIVEIHEYCYNDYLSECRAQITSNEILLSFFAVGTSLPRSREFGFILRSDCPYRCT